LLALSADQRAKVDELVASRAADVSAALHDNMDLFLEIQAARQGNDFAGARPLMRQLRQKVTSLIDPPLSEQVAEQLPQASREEFTRLVSEYTQALAAEESAGRNPAASGPDSDRTQRRQTATRPGSTIGAAAGARYELNQLVREMARTLSSIVSERRERTEALITAVEATPEQQARIEAILRQMAEQNRTAGNTGASTPAAERRAESISQIMTLLAPEQQKKFREFLRKP
jgi:hypothetical protein